MMDLEQHLDRGIDEGAFSTVEKVADLEQAAPASSTALEPPIVFPIFNRRWPARIVRRFALPYFLLPLTRVFAHIHVTGRENLDAIQGPVIFASNHVSLLDVPVILASLPNRFRFRLATAMAKEIFDVHFFPNGHTLLERFGNTLNYRLATFVFNAFPLPQHQAGTRQAIRYVGEMAEQGWSILIFPEGDRTRSGALLPFRPGIGMIGSHLSIPVVPLRTIGLDKVLHRDWKFPSPGRVEVRIGKPILLSGDRFSEQARKVETAIAALAI